VTGTAKTRLLLVEDNPGDARLVREMLDEPGLQDIELTHVRCMRDAERHLARHPTDVVLLDLGLSDTQGLEGVRRAHAAAPRVPVVMLTLHDDEAVAAQALYEGAQDYLLKGQIDAHGLQRALRYAIDRNAAEEALRESERRFSDLLANVTLISVMLDCSGRITYCNDYLLRLTGWRHDEVIGRDWFALFASPPHQQLRELFSALLLDGKNACRHQGEILTRAGARRLINWNNSVLRAASGEIIGTASIGEDVTEQRRAARKIKNLNRVHAVLSGITAHVMRVQDRGELYRQACRVAVEDGGFVMAWIGIVDPGAGVLRPVASAGDVRDFFESVPRALTNCSSGCTGLAGRAIHEKKPMISYDVTTDPQEAVTKALTNRGISACAVIPLVVNGEAVGILALYAGEGTGFFDEEEMSLLVQLADNISSGLEHVAKSEKLDYLAYYDPLTGLANRTLFLDRLGQKLIAAADQERKVAVFAIDIERFRMVNDALGRKAGDELLRQVAARLRQAGHLDSHFSGVAGDHFAALRDGSRLARVAADQFAVVSTEAQNEEYFAELTERNLKQCFSAPFQIGESEVRVSARIGIAVFPTDGADAESLLSNATAALGKAKATGEHYAFYAQELNERSAETLMLENRLRHALDRKEFVLHYQPKVELRSRRIVGVEALIRWESPELGLVAPMRFIPLMEETGMILEMGAWALCKAAADQLRWVEMGLLPTRVAVNVSAVQFRSRDFVATIREAVRQGSQPPALDLEITESLFMHNIEDTIAKLQEVRSLGVTIAIDDFGTGYSSLAYLAKLPVETLKIDRSFVSTMLHDADTMTLVQMIISLAHSLRLRVVAEGVESEEQAQMLRRLRCDEMQGYLFSRPVGSEALTILLQAQAAKSAAHIAVVQHKEGV
jgi:diguanylate cyclase (GGDEF)-like protein/PAS domain S-box-containing protein